MGNPSPDTNFDESSNEGDISWADRFLEYVLLIYLSHPYLLV
jgi:hypothetical protein